MSVRENSIIWIKLFWIRIRMLLRTGLHIGAIALFLVGVFAIQQARLPADEPVLFGRDVPAVAGFEPYETMAYGGILVMMIGLGLCYRWIIASPVRRGY